MANLKISVIIPCYNEEQVIEATHKRVTKVMKDNAYKDYEIFYINDGSTDATLKILKKIAAADKKVKAISFSRNFGHQPAVSAGIQSVSGDVAIIIDADLQDPPELFPEMVRLYLEGNDVVYGVRRERKGESFFKKITAKLFYRVINFLSDVPLPLDTGDFRLISRKVMDAFKSMKETHKYIRGLISWAGFKQTPVYYARDARFAGETKYPLSKMIQFATNGLLYFSKKPLKLAMTLGFLSILVGLGLSIYTVFAFILHKTASGWASLIISVVFFGGVQLLTIGVLGEYIGSIFDEVKHRPEFIIEDKINF
jgi:dolichol-phosphate mannosyltransferase